MHSDSISDAQMQICVFYYVFTQSRIALQHTMAARSGDHISFSWMLQDIFFMKRLLMQMRSKYKVKRCWKM